MLSCAVLDAFIPCRQDHPDGGGGGRAEDGAADGSREEGLRVSLPDIVSGDLPEHGFQSVLLRGASRQHDSSAQDVLQAALLDMVEDGVDQFAVAGGDDLGDVPHGDLPVGVRDADLEDLVAVRPELVRLACAEASFDLLREVFFQGALGLDVARDALSAERDGVVVSHDASPVDGYRGDARPDVHEGHAPFHLFLAEGSLCHDLRQEVLLEDPDARSLEDLVNRLDGLPSADEDLELAFDRRGQGAHDLPFGQLHSVFHDEGLGNRPVDGLMVRVRERVALEGVRLDGPDLFRGDVLFGVLALERRRGRDLGDVVPGKADDYPRDLDHQRGLGLGDGLADRLRGQHGDVDGTGLNAFGRKLLVMDDMDVPFLDLGYTKTDLGAPQIERREVLFFKLIHGVLIKCLIYGVS